MLKTLDELRIDAEQASQRGSIVDLEACLQHVSAFDSAGALAIAARIRGQIAYLRSDYETALADYRMAHALFSELADEQSVAGALGNIGSVLFAKGSYSEALDHFRRALEIHEQHLNSGGIARISNNIALIHAETGDSPAALESFHRALEAHRRIGNRKGIAITTGNIGIVFSLTGKYPEALRQFHEALALYEEADDLASAAGVLGNIGNIHNSTGSYGTALEYYQQAFRMHESTGNRSGMANVLGNIGNAHVQLYDHSQACVHLEQAIEIYREIGDQAGYIATLSNYLIVLITAERYDDAQRILSELDTLHIDEPSIRVTREIGRSSLEIHQQSYEVALLTLRSALSLATKLGLRKEQADLHRRLRDLSQHTNDFAGYIHHNTVFTQLQEEINGKQVSVQLAMQDKQREIDAKDREVQKQLAVLHSTLPKHVAERVARGEVVNDAYEDAAVLFLDVVGFTTFSSTRSATEVVELLQKVFTSFDALCVKHGVVKIKTIGDAYLAVAFPDDACTQCERLAQCALEMQAVDMPGVAFRIGLHLGPLVAGVIGTERLQYDVWGDTVNVASRMESSGEAGRVQVSEAFALNLKKNTESRIQNPISESHEVPLVTIERGSIDIKGKGPMQTYWLERA